MFINNHTEETFVSAEEKTIIDMNGKTRNIVRLKREDGTVKEVSDKAFKNNYTEVSEAEPEPEAVPAKLNKHQLVAKEQLENAFNWIVGALENDVADGNAEEMPPVEQMFEEVYSEATSHTYGVGSCSQKPAPAAMQFAGKQFIIDTLVVLFTTNGYEVPEHLTKVPEKKQGAKRVYKDTPDHVGEDEVVMRAFTGMLIGVFKVVKKTKTYIQVELANGTSLKFNKSTGVQVDAPNPKFANRIEV